MGRAININTRNASSEFKLMLSEKTTEDLADEVDDIRNAILTILAANDAPISYAAEEKSWGGRGLT